MSVVKIPPEGDPIVCSEEEMNNEIKQGKGSWVDLGCSGIVHSRLRDIRLRCSVSKYNPNYSLKNRCNIIVYIYGEDIDKDPEELTYEDCLEIIKNKIRY